MAVAGWPVSRRIWLRPYSSGTATCAGAPPAQLLLADGIKALAVGHVADIPAASVLTLASESRSELWGAAAALIRDQRMCAPPTTYQHPGETVSATLRPRLGEAPP